MSRVLKLGCLLFLCLSLARAYTVVTSTSPALEQAFLAATTTQFNVSITSNPFFANTYQVKLLGTNPNYILPGQVAPSAPAQIDQDVALMVGISSFTYPYGWAAGMTCERSNDLDLLGQYFVNCSSVTAFEHVYSTTGTWNPGTCSDTLMTLNDAIFQQNLSTPTPILGF